MFFCFTVGRPMFMFVVYTSRVKGNALLAPNEPTAEPAAEDGCNLEGGEVARAAAVAGRGRWEGGDGRGARVKGGDATTGKKGASGNNF